MATSVTVTKVTQESAPSTRWRVRFSDGTELEFDSLDDAKRLIGDLDSGASGQRTAQLFAIGWFLARQPDGGNPNLVEGKTLTLDLSAANPVRVQ